MSNSDKESYFKAIEHSDLYQRLKTYIRCKNYSAITEFLNQHNSEEFQQYIVDVGGSDFDFFGNNKPSETAIIVNKIVSVFNKEHQLKFVSKLIVGNVHYSTLSLLIDKLGLLDSRILQEYISYKMHKNKFDDIIKVSEALNTNILTYESNHLAYYKKIITQPLLMKVQLKEKAYKGMYDIIYAYTPEKEQFLKSQNIALPSVECAQAITATIIDNINNAKNSEQYFYEGLKNYSSKMLYAELQESLPKNNKTKSYTKI